MKALSIPIPGLAWYWMQVSVEDSSSNETMGCSLHKRRWHLADQTPKLAIWRTAHSKGAVVPSTSAKPSL